MWESESDQDKSTSVIQISGDIWLGPKKNGYGDGTIELKQRG